MSLMHAVEWVESASSSQHKVFPGQVKICLNLYGMPAQGQCLFFSRLWVLHSLMVLYGVSTTRERVISESGGGVRCTTYSTGPVM